METIVFRCMRCIIILDEDGSLKAWQAFCMRSGNFQQLSTTIFSILEINVLQEKNDWLIDL